MVFQQTLKTMNTNISHRIEGINKLELICAIKTNSITRLIGCSIKSWIIGIKRYYIFLFNCYKWRLSPLLQEHSWLSIYRFHKYIATPPKRALTITKKQPKKAINPTVIQKNWVLAKMLYGYPTWSTSAINLK